MFTNYIKKGGENPALYSSTEAKARWMVKKGIAPNYHAAILMLKGEADGAER